MSILEIKATNVTEDQLVWFQQMAYILGGGAGGTINRRQKPKDQRAPKAAEIAHSLFLDRVSD